MGTARAAAGAGQAAVLPPEELTWDPAVTLVGESRPPSGEERGFVLRLHGDPDCPVRLAPGTPLRAHSYEQARADALCPRCTAAAVTRSSSSVLRRLRDSERTLRRLLATAHDAPVPREIVHCRALRYEADQASSVHPHVMAYAAEVSGLAGEVMDALRAGLIASLRPR